MLFLLSLRKSMVKMYWCKWVQTQKQAFLRIWILFQFVFESKFCFSCVRWPEVQAMHFCARMRVANISGVSLIPSTFFFFFFSRLQSTFSMQLLVDSKQSQWIASLSMVYSENFLFYAPMFTFILVQLPMMNEACFQGTKRLRNIYRKNATRTGLAVDAVQHLFAILNVAKCNRMALMSAQFIFLFQLFFFFLFSLLRGWEHSDTDMNNDTRQKKMPTALYAILVGFTFSLGKQTKKAKKRELEIIVATKD